MSRRAAEKYIADGRVTVNGAAAMIGMDIDPLHDTVEIDGKKAVLSKQENVYIALNKPRGYLTTVHDDRGRHTVSELVSDVSARVYPAGRLDYNSEGLLILTNDGDFANRLMHPSNEKNKTYTVKVRGYDGKSIDILSSPLEIDGYKIKPAKVDLIERRGENAVLKIIIHEGRNRQIRKMCEIANLEVLSLKRVKIGGIELGNLERGKWRYLTRSEIDSI